MNHEAGTACAPFLPGGILRLGVHKSSVPALRRGPGAKYTQAIHGKHIS